MKIEAWVVTFEYFFDYSWNDGIEVFSKLEIAEQWAENQKQIKGFRNVSSPIRLVSDLERENLKSLVLKFIGSLTLCDHMGDVHGQVTEMLKQMGEENLTDFETLSELADLLNQRGVTTLQGTSLGE